MPTEVFQDRADFTIRVVETVPPVPGDSALPYPRLRKTERTDRRSFDSVILENAYLRVTILPALGGRIVGMFDKRTQTELLPAPEVLELAERGSRGVEMDFGIQLSLDGTDRPNALGIVGTHLDALEEDETAVWIGETSAGTSIGFHAMFRLPANAALLEVRMVAQNRGFVAAPYNAGLTFGGGQLTAQVGDAAGALIMLASGTHVGALGLSSVRQSENRAHIERFDGKRWLQPHQVDEWIVNLVPLTGLDPVSAFGLAGGLSLSATKIAYQATEPMAKAKLFLLTSEGQTLEAPMDVYPEHTVEIPTSELPSSPQALILRDSAGNVLLDTNLLEALPLQSSTSVQVPTTPRISQPTLEMNAFELADAAFDVAQRPMVYTIRGFQLLGEANFPAAEQQFDQALLFNGEDPLNWWGKAVAQRYTGEEGGDAMANGLFLAPLEPALRAEAFLRQAQDQGRDPNPFLAPLGATPESFIDVACLYLSAGLYMDASRWIDEALRHRPMAMLHYLHAYGLLTKSRMSMEAGEHVSRASKLPLEAPYPWRPIEHAALTTLTNRFPNDEQLARYASLVVSRY